MKIHVLCMQGPRSHCQSNLGVLTFEHFRSDKHTPAGSQRSVQRHARCLLLPRFQGGCEEQGLAFSSERLELTCNFRRDCCNRGAKRVNHQRPPSGRDNLELRFQGSDINRQQWRLGMTF